MKKIKLTTPENIELEVELAEVFSRVTAAVIDLVIQSLVILIVIWGYSVLLHYMANNEGWDRWFGWAVAALILIIAIIMEGYFIFFEMKWCGQTPGKRIMHLRVIKNNGGPVTIKEVVIRNLLRGFIDNQGIGVIMMFFGKENKRLGDLAAGTMVITEEKNQRPVALEEMITISDELKGYLSQEEYNLLRTYFERKHTTLENYDQLRKEMKEYFSRKFREQGLEEKSQAFIESI